MLDNLEKDDCNHQLIRSLTENATGWILKCKLVNIADIHFYDTAKGFGSVQKIILIDKQGDRMQASIFNDAIKTFEPILRKGQVYTISKAKLKEAKAKYNAGTSKFEMILGTDSIISESKNPWKSKNIMRYEFQTLSSLSLDKIEMIIDVKAIVIAIGDTVISNTKSSTSSNLVRRDLMIIDETKQNPIQLTLWGKLALEQGNSIFKLIESKPILIATSLKIQAFRGVSLSSTSNTMLEINPSIKEVEDLKNWILLNQFDINRSLESMSTSNIKGESATISEVLSNVASGTTLPCLYRINACLTEMNRHEPWYIACKPCNKKLVELDKKLTCTECFNNDNEQIYRYMMRVKISDATGQLWIELFDKRVEKILGCTVEQLRALKERDTTKFIRCMEKCMGLRSNFTIKVSEINDGIRAGHQYTCITMEDVLGDTACKISEDKMKAKDDDQQKEKRSLPQNIESDEEQDEKETDGDLKTINKHKKIKQSNDSSKGKRK